jgi:hypothetical protein
MLSKNFRYNINSPESPNSQLKDIYMQSYASMSEELRTYYAKQWDITDEL